MTAGGNAIDAAASMSICLTLLEPHLCGIGGEVPTLIYSARERKTYAISGMGWSPAAFTVDWCRERGIDLIPGDGYLPACVPAVVGTWATALARFGTMSLAEILQPAIELAEQGFPGVRGAEPPPAPGAGDLHRALSRPPGRSTWNGGGAPACGRGAAQPRLRRHAAHHVPGRGGREGPRPGGRYRGRLRRVLPRRDRRADRAFHRRPSGGGCQRRRPQRVADVRGLRRLARRRGGAGDAQLPRPGRVQVLVVDPGPGVPAAARDPAAPGYQGGTWPQLARLPARLDRVRQTGVRRPRGVLRRSRFRRGPVRRTAVRRLRRSGAPPRSDEDRLP